MVENSYQITCGLFSQKFVLEKVSKKLTAKLLPPPPPKKKRKKERKQHLRGFCLKFQKHKQKFLKHNCNHSSRVIL